MKCRVKSYFGRPIFRGSKVLLDVLYHYSFEAGKVNGKRKRISKSGFETKKMKL